MKYKVYLLDKTLEADTPIELHNLVWDWQIDHQVSEEDWTSPAVWFGNEVIGAVNFNGRICASEPKKED